MSQNLNNLHIQGIPDLDEFASSSELFNNDILDSILNAPSYSNTSHAQSQPSQLSTDFNPAVNVSSDAQSAVLSPTGTHLDSPSIYLNSSIYEDPLDVQLNATPTSQFPVTDNLTTQAAGAFSNLQPTQSSPLPDYQPKFEDESAFVDDTNDNPMLLTGHFLIPPGEVGHYRSNSINSETSSVGHSPLYAPSSPLLPLAANSPSFNTTGFDDPLQGLTGLEQLTGDFSLGEPHPYGGQPQQRLPQLPIGVNATTNDVITAYTQHRNSEDQQANTPEITIDVVDLFPGDSTANFSPYVSSPGSPYSDFEAFPTIDVTGSSLVPPPANNRRRSHSDSDLGPEINTSQHFYLNSNHGSNVSVNSVVSDVNNYLSPDAAISSKARKERAARALRNRSHSASQLGDGRSRSRSRSASRDYILELASEQSGGLKRSQRHPSTFACDLCDKTFTRAYNLRSHKRTHTNERPFACSVCNKAFARQHDRKRHEALHSGEKKYVCSGLLADGITSWGCGHKFARADALGRHFKTEAGKECIRSLVEESERDRILIAQGAKPLRSPSMPTLPSVVVNEINSYFEPESQQELSGLNGDSTNF
jgi:hypothetical protein